MQQFYAKYQTIDSFIYAFNSEQRRDEWISTKPENPSFIRVVLPEKEARRHIRQQKLNKRESDGYTIYTTGAYPHTPTTTINNLSSNKNQNKKESVTMANLKKKFTEVAFDPTPDLDLIGRRKLAENILRNAVTVGEKTFAYIDVDMLRIPDYQRDRSTHAYRIFENWDIHKCDPIHVSYKDDIGMFNIINGQHRTIAAKMRGVKQLVCEIETGMTDSEESFMFVEQNDNTKKLSPFDLFKANLCIADEEDTEISKLDKRIKKVCDKYGIQVKKSQACGTLKTVPHARRIMRREGEDGLEFIFDVVQGSHWDRDPRGYSYVALESFRKVYNTYSGNLDFAKRKLINYLKDKSPTDIENEGNRNYPDSGRMIRWDSVMRDIIGQ